MSKQNCIMIYDGECPYCKVASVTVDNIHNDINIINWENEVSQKFLEKQFGEAPFGLVFIDPNKDKIWLGADATEEISKRADQTKPISNVLKNNYDLIADTISFLNNRQKNIDTYEGVYNIKDKVQPIIYEMYEVSEDKL